MNDTLPTVWEAEQHTLVKHKILERYLKAWLPILTQQARRLQQQHRQITLHSTDSRGRASTRITNRESPVIALKTAMNHTVKFPVPVEMLFIELEKPRFEHL